MTITFLQAWQQTPYLEGEVSSVSHQTAQTLGAVIDPLSEHLGSSSPGAVALRDELMNRALDLGEPASLMTRSSIVVGSTVQQLQGPVLLSAFATTFHQALALVQSQSRAPTSLELSAWWQAGWTYRSDHLDAAVLRWLEQMAWTG